jgi:hypothetical protein
MYAHRGKKVQLLVFCDRPRNGKVKKCLWSSLFWWQHLSQVRFYIIDWVFLFNANSAIYQLYPLSSKSSDRKCLVNIRDILKRIFKGDTDNYRKYWFLYMFTIWPSWISKASVDIVF